VLIVGGGASGVLLACHLLRGADADLHVTLIEKRSAIGRGMAYSTAQPGHLLNVRATNMSAYADDPLHFCRWLAARGGETCDGQGRPPLFAQRYLYGVYISELITPYLAGEDAKLAIVHGEARSLSTGAQGVRIELDDGRQIEGDVAVLATGHDEIARGGPACYVSPWESPSDAGIDKDASVLIRGTGLTMVDFVISLRAAGHRGPIYAVSRRGLLPQPHRQVEALPVDRSEIPFGASLVTLWRWLRRRAKEEVARGGDWRSVVDGIRPFTWEIWKQLPFDSKQRFLRHARAWWETHRHRMAPEIEAEINAALASGQLRILAAKTAAVEPSQAGARVTYRRRGRSETETLAVSRVAECTGVYTDPLATTNRLLKQLLDRGLARPDPLGIGIDVDDICAVRDRSGTASPLLYAVGPLTRAAFWEIMAVPDIRVQCAELARHLQARLGGAAARSAFRRMGGSA
jgi:uncharacterized NAD(P)/FAD-binding protein YdhS